MTQDPAVAQPSVLSTRIPLWRFVLPLLVQVAIVAAVPLPQAIILATGTTVYLQTVPVDPYDILRGRYVTLNYEIGQRSNLEKLPGWSEVKNTYGPIYVVVEPPAGSGDPTRPWRAVALSKDFPSQIGPEQRAIRGFYNGWQIDFGLGAYYFDEQIGDGLEKDLRANQATARVEAKVDGRGNAALVGLWVRERKY